MFRRISLTVVGLTCLSLAAADWPQWRGPDRNSISKERGLLGEWPEAGPKLVWQVNDLGTGYSTPAVVGERMYLISNQGDDNEFVQALSTTDGSQIWSTRIGRVGPNTKMPYPGARSTPTVDGDVMYVLGSDGDLACLTTDKGTAVWSKSLRNDFGGKPGAWAYSESPLVDGEVLVVTPGGDEATLVALNKKSGNVIWKSAIEGEEAGYASVIIVETGGIKQYVQFIQKGLVGVEAKTGKLLWRYDQTATGSPANIPTPVSVGPYVYSASGLTGGGLVKLTASGGAVTAEEMYFSKKLPTAIGGSIPIDGNLYGTSRTMMCVDFETGELKWQDRSIGTASLCLAENRLYLHGENGDVALVEPSADGYIERGRFTPPNQPDRGRSKAWAYPVVANGKLYIHDFGTLWCYDIRDRNATE